jgi:acetolactate synthase-1/3 small subunit
MKDQYPDTCRISIYAEDTNRVMSRILQLFMKSRFTVNYVQVFKTGDAFLTLILLDVSFPKEMMPLILNQIEKILEVHRAFPHNSERKKQFLGLYTVPPDFCDRALWATLKDRGVQVSTATEDTLVLQLIGAEEEIEEVHSLLSPVSGTAFYKSLWPDMNGLPVIPAGLEDAPGSQPPTRP